MKTDLEQSFRGTETIDREKERSPEWKDKVISVEAKIQYSRTVTRYHLDFSCDRRQRFRLSESDYQRAVETMISELPYQTLLRINKFVAQLLADAFDVDSQQVKEHAKDKSPIRILRQKTLLVSQLENRELEHTDHSPYLRKVGRLIPLMPAKSVWSFGCQRSSPRSTRARST